MISKRIVQGTAVLAIACAAAAQDVPLSYVAAPAVYKLLAEDGNFRVILATWQPGQKDVQHSHSAAAVYRLTDCTSRLFGADGKVIGEGSAKAGSTVLQNMISAHSVENIGTSECRILLVERK